MCWFDCFIGWFSFSFFLFFFGLHRRRRCRRCRRCCCCCYCYCCSASEMWLLFLISLYRRAGGRSLCGGHCDVIVAALSVSFFGDSGTILQSLSLSLSFNHWILDSFHERGTRFWNSLLRAIKRFHLGIDLPSDRVEYEIKKYFSASVRLEMSTVR